MASGNDNSLFGSNFPFDHWNIPSWHDVMILSLRVASAVCISLNVQVADVSGFCRLTFIANCEKNFAACSRVKLLSTWNDHTSSYFVSQFWYNHDTVSCVTKSGVQANALLAIAQQTNQKSTNFFIPMWLRIKHSHKLYCLY